MYVTEVDFVLAYFIVPYLATKSSVDKAGPIQHRLVSCMVNLVSYVR